MPIRSISVSNFKSFRSLDIELNAFSIIIGSNASGKSNFMHIFIFLRDIAKYGLGNAISLQGGVEYLRNTLIGRDEDTVFRITYSLDAKSTDIIGAREQVPVYFESSEITYEFSLRYFGTGEYEISRDQLIVFGDYYRQGAENMEHCGAGTIQLSQKDGMINYTIFPPGGLLLEEKDLFPYAIQGKERIQKMPLLNMPIKFPGIPPLEWIFRGIKVYDFDPHLLKKAVPVMGKTELEKDGSNLAIVVKRVCEDKDKKKLFTDLMNDILPFVEDIAVEKLMDMTLFLTMKETYAGRRYIPASMISDGTINIAALIIALYFEERPVTIIEEPERNIHPHLISRLVAMLKDASHHKQIMVTTHNPEMVKHVDPADLLLISRDDKGFSRISRPADKEEIRAFLEQEIGIEELFIQDLLGIE